MALIYLTYAQATSSSRPGHHVTVLARGHMSNTKAWRRLVRHGVPLQLRVLIVLYNDSVFLCSQNRVLCVVSSACMPPLHCKLTVAGSL
jgi:hypothetical protein